MIARAPRAAQWDAFRSWRVTGDICLYVPCVPHATLTTIIIINNICMTTTIIIIAVTYSACTATSSPTRYIGTSTQAH